MRCAILVFSLSLIFAIAFDDVAQKDNVVPEETLLEVDDDQEARNALTEMQAAGASDKECRELTEKTKTDISTVVTTNQKIIDELPKGNQCTALGQVEVTQMRQLKKKADEHLVECRTRLTATQTFKVEFGSRVYSSLTVGQCATFFSSTNYVTAKASYNAAVKAEQIAVGSAKEAATNLQIAITTAAKYKAACLCKTKANHDKAFTERSAANAANEKAWDKAHRILCVLNGEHPCRVPKCPVLAKATLTTEAQNAKDCSKATRTIATGRGCAVEDGVKTTSCSSVEACAKWAATSCSSGAFMFSAVYWDAWGTRCCKGTSPDPGKNPNWTGVYHV